MNGVSSDIELNAGTQTPGLLTKPELARYLKISTRMIELLMARGELPFVRLGRRSVRFDLHDVLAELKSRSKT